MRKNIFIFAVSIITVLGMCPMARANIVDQEYVRQQLADKLDAKDEVIQEKHLATGIMNKINNAYNGLGNKLDKAYDAANKYKVLTVDKDGNVTPEMVKIPVGSATAPTDVAQVWIQQ